MKNLILITLLLPFSYLHSQNLGIDFNATGTGRNLTATISKAFNNNEIGFGLGYNINSLNQPGDQNNIYYKRLYATDPLQHINIDMFYQRRIFTNLEHIDPFVFFDAQVKYSTTRNSFINTAPQVQVVYFGPFLWVENYVGVGFDVEVYKNWYLSQRIGFGGYSVIGYDDRLGGNYAWEFAGILSAGVGYRFQE